MVKKNEPKRRNNKRREIVMEPKFTGSIPPSGGISHYNEYTNPGTQINQNTGEQNTNTQIMKPNAPKPTNKEPATTGNSLLDTLETIGDPLYAASQIYDFFRNGRARDFTGFFRRVPDPLDYEEGARMARNVIRYGRDPLDFLEGARGARPGGLAGVGRVLQEAMGIARTVGGVARTAAGIGRFFVL